MKQLTIETIRSYEPCYDPIKYINEDFKGTVLDILNLDNVNAGDRLWVVLRTDLLSDKLLRLFAVWCARQVVQYNDDPRVINAIEVAEKYAHGNATAEELAAAESAAWRTRRFANWNDVSYYAAESAEYAARSAAEYAAEYAARSAARSAAEYAAEYAARSAARSAAWCAAWEVAYSAAKAAAYSVASPTPQYAAYSVEAGAWDAAWYAQIDKLKEMIIEGIDTGDVK